jgi:signal transduction histidine kinase
MATLIDDLLKLSRITRTEIKREPVSLTALAQEVIEELRRQSPDRSVEVDIAPDLEVRGDRGLLRIALANLLNNAWKFTGKVANARISLSRVSAAAVPTFVVGDNGAGFDMAYADARFYFTLEPEITA